MSDTPAPRAGLPVVPVVVAVPKGGRIARQTTAASFQKLEERRKSSTAMARNRRPYSAQSGSGRSSNRARSPSPQRRRRSDQ